MFMQAIVLSGDVAEFKDFDSRTGAEQAGYTVRLAVFDADTDEKYTVQLNDGFPRLEELKELKRQKQPIDVLRQVADQLRAELPPKMTTVPLEVLRIKGKSASYLTLVCRFAQAAASAAA